MHQSLETKKPPVLPLGCADSFSRCSNSRYLILCSYAKSKPQGLALWFAFWRRWRDLNPRTPCGAYRISNPDPSATWVHLHWQLTPPLCHIPAQVASPLLRFLPADAGWGRNRPLPAPIGRFRGSRGPWGDSSGSGRTEPGSEPPQPSLSEWRWFPRRSATAARTAAPPPARRWHTRA